MCTNFGNQQQNILNQSCCHLDNLSQTKIMRSMKKLFAKYIKKASVKKDASEI